MPSSACCTTPPLTVCVCVRACVRACVPTACRYTLNPWTLVADAQHPNVQHIDRQAVGSTQAVGSSTQAVASSTQAVASTQAVGVAGGSAWAPPLDTAAPTAAANGSSLSSVSALHALSRHAQGAAQGVEQGVAQEALLQRAFGWTTALRGRTVAIVHPFNVSVCHSL